MKIIQETNVTLQDQLKQLQKEKKEMVDEINKKNQDVNEQKVSKQTLLKELSDKTTENICLQNQIKQSKQQIENMKQETNNINSEKSKLSEDLRNVLNTNSELKVSVDQLKNNLEKKNEQLQQSNQINQQLEKNIQQNEVLHKREISEIEAHVNILKQEYFFAMALALKLSMLMEKKDFHNRSIQNLWEKINEIRIPLNEWKSYATRYLSSEKEI